MKLVRLRGPGHRTAIDLECRQSEAATALWIPQTDRLEILQRIQSDVAPDKSGLPMHSKSTAEVCNDLDEFLRMLGRWQMSAIAENNQL